MSAAPVVHPPVVLAHGDALAAYAGWPAPTVIVSDGAYGVGGFVGDPKDVDGLVPWYAPHVRAWAERALPSTTLWFWNTEVGWATVHPLLVASGFEYRCAHVWDKGMAHAAGNANTKTLRKYPVVSEVCVQYVRDVRLEAGGQLLTLKAWLRREWERTGLPLNLTNEACGVRNAATRKYFTQCHLWYFPPVDAFERFVAFANARGRPAGRPYFSVDGARPMSSAAWETLRAKFHCQVGITNVWREPAVRGAERLKTARGDGGGPGLALHGNQKPLKLLDRIIRASSDAGDVVWDPFAGVGSVAIAARDAGRAYCGAEVAATFHALALARLAR